MSSCTIYLDIETIPAQDETVRDEIRAGVKPPGNISKAETIAAWNADKRPAAEWEAIHKTGFDPALGHVCTIGWAVDDDPVSCTFVQKVTDGMDSCEQVTDKLIQEAGVLRAFFDAVPEYHDVTFVGHNIAAFDLRFLLCRAVILGVRLPARFPRDPKPWGHGVFDTMTAWAGTKGTISLDRLCRALGIEGKDGFDGSQVAEAWAKGEHDKIAEYCAADVDRVRDIHRRFQAAGF
jgi:DNA polymerase elongation subunit (family B)